MTKPQRTQLANRSDITLATESELVHQLDPTLLNTSGGSQMRAELNQETVDNYTALMLEANGWGPFPPIVAFYDGTTYWIGDGFHRVNAARICGPMILPTVPVKVSPGDRRAAILYAVGANAAHGLPRTSADKRRSVETLLLDDEWKQWSHREIARRCQVSPDTVGRIYRELSLSESDSETVAQNGRSYTTKHGTTAVMNTANIGRKPDPPGSWTLTQKITPWLEQARSTPEEQQALIRELVAQEHRHPDYQAITELLPDGWRVRELKQAFTNIIDNLSWKVGKNDWQPHQLPSGVWYARNLCRQAEATPPFPTAEAAIESAHNGQATWGWNAAYSHIKSVLENYDDRNWKWNLQRLEESWPAGIKEATLGLRQKLPATPKGTEVRERLDYLEQRAKVFVELLQQGQPAQPIVAAPPAVELPKLIDTYGDDPKLALKAIISAYQYTLHTLDEYEKHTGFFGHRKPLRDALQPMIEIAERKLDQLQGYKVTALR